MGGGLILRWSARIDSLVDFVERDRFSIYATFVYVLILGTIRDFAEYYLLDQEFVTTAHPWIYSIAHHVGFYVVVYLGLILLLTAFSGRGFRRSRNFITSIFWIIVLPPFLDHYIFGSNFSYAYYSWTEFLNAFFHFQGSTFHVGQGVEIVFILGALFGYVIWTQREKLGDIRERAIVLLQIGFMIFFTILSMFLIATPESYLPVGSSGGIPVFPDFAITKFYQFHLFFVAYYLIAAILVIVITSYVAAKKIFSDLWMSFRPLQTVFFAGVVAGGIITGWRTMGNMDYVTKILERPYWVNIEFVVMSIVSALLAWEVSAIWNDISDRQTDSKTRKGRIAASGKIGTKALFQWSLVLATVSILISMLQSVQQMIVIVVVLALAYLYSFKPVRFKDHVLSPIMIGAGGFLAFLYGYLTPFSTVVVITGGVNPIIYLDGTVTFPVVAIQGLLIALFILFGLAIGSMITDISGYEEDVLARVKTVYTQIGIEKGVRIVSVLIFLASLMPFLLFNNLQDLVVFPVLGLSASVVFLKYRSSRPTMLIALVGFAYATLRYIGVL